MFTLILLVTSITVGDVKNISGDSVVLLSQLVIHCFNLVGRHLPTHHHHHRHHHHYKINNNDDILINSKFCSTSSVSGWIPFMAQKSMHSWVSRIPPKREYPPISMIISSVTDIPYIKISGVSMISKKLI